MSEYTDIRKAGRELHAKVLVASHALDYDLMQVAKRLGVRRSGRTLIFEEETEQNAFMDFQLHEFPIQGRSLLAAINAQSLDLTPLEEEIRHAWLESRTSLFRAVRIHQGQHQIELEDCLDPTRPRTFLTDINLTNSAAQIGMLPLLFTRDIKVRGISMSSGFSLAFHPDDELPLLQGYRHKTKSVPPAELSERRFAYFFAKHRESGARQEFADVI